MAYLLLGVCVVVIVSSAYSIGYSRGMTKALRESMKDLDELSADLERLKALCTHDRH